jgi:hypothetical protein
VYAFRSWTPQFGLTVLTRFRSAYPLQACSQAYLAFNAFFPIGTSGSTFLWLFRLRAIYGGDRIATFIFGFLWLAVAGSSTTLAIGGGTPITVGSSAGCVIVGAKSKIGALTVYDDTRVFLVISTAYDTLVFLAISYRLVSNVTQTQLTPWGLINALFGSSNLAGFSKILFTEGQFYYMCVSVHPFRSRQYQFSGRITVILNILAMLLGLIPHLSPAYHGLLTIPSVTLTSILTCRVYRRTRLGILRGHSDPTLPTVNHLGPSRNLTVPLSVAHFSTESSREAHLGDGANSTADKIVTRGTLTK